MAKHLLQKDQPELAAEELFRGLVFYQFGGPLDKPEARTLLERLTGCSLEKLDQLCTNTRPHSGTIFRQPSILSQILMAAIRVFGEAVLGFPERKSRRKWGIQPCIENLPEIRCWAAVSIRRMLAKEESFGWGATRSCWDQLTEAELDWFRWLVDELESGGS